MIKSKLITRRFLTHHFKKIIVSLVFFNLILSFLCFSSIFNYFFFSPNLVHIDHKDDLKSSAVWANINITNYQLNNTRHYHNSTISIEGNLKYNNGTAVQYTEVAIFVDDILDPQFMNTTDDFGIFQINFRIPYSFDVYSVSGYKIQVNVTDDSRGKVKKDNFLIIFANASSSFDVNYYDSPYIPGENFVLSGFLRYDNINGNGIPNSQINYNWYNTTYSWPLGSFFTTLIDGSISATIQIPLNASSNSINLNLTYIGDIPYIDSSQKVLANIRLFNNFNCIWNTVSNASERDLIAITGQLSSSETPSLKIYNRYIRIFYDGNLINFTDTDNNGTFHYDYRIPAGIGNKTVRIELIDTAPGNLLSSTSINISAGVITLPPPADIPQPLLGFFLVFVPILISVIAGLAVYGFYYYRKQDKLSKVVNLPLESKITNLKILKETGRLEESLSYLFNAIYMDLIRAKFGRIRKGNETIRDFAIISVKNLKLSPATIYPFIQKVEEIIYAKPFQITDKEFYGTINLFSPIYFELTGYNFELNF